MLLQWHMLATVPYFTDPATASSAVNGAPARLRAALPWLGSVAVHGAVMLCVGMGAQWVSQPTIEPLMEVVDVAMQAPVPPRDTPAVTTKPAPRLTPVPLPVPLPLPVSVPVPVNQTVAAPIQQSPAAPQTNVASVTAPQLPATPPTPVSVPAPAAPSAAPAAKAQPASSAAPATASAATVHADYKTAYLQNPAPERPKISERMGEIGLVLLWVTVNAAGSVDDLGVLQTSGFPRLDNAAIKAVRQWRFSPAKRGGVAVSDKVSVPIDFQ